MGAKVKKFIVLCVGDKDAYGYDEHTLPLLLHLIDASTPDARIFTHTGVVAYYQICRHALGAIKDAVSRAERLRDSDSRFSTLGIGLAHGDLIANFDWLGRLKQDSTPMGMAVNHASAGVRDAKKYNEILKELHETLH